MAIFLQIIIHEAGHLMFGLISGYRFSSFRVGSLMLIKKEGTIKLRRLSIAGTGGQCLLNPPEMKDEKYPYVLYNFGGSIINLVSSVLFAVVAIQGSNINIFTYQLVILAVTGTIFAFLNGIPMRLGMVNNDGYNAFSIGKSRESLRAFWIILKGNELIVSGTRPKDMPDEWFVMPSEESMKNSMTASIGILACNRLMDQMKFEEAKQLMEQLSLMDTGIVGLNRKLLVVDRIYCELISDNSKDILNNILDKEQKKFMKLMKNYPSVLRTKYVYALLAEKDDRGAEQIKAKFEKIAKKYPFPSEIIAERELMLYAEGKGMQEQS